MNPDGSQMPRQYSNSQCDGISNKRGLSPLTFTAQSSFDLTVVPMDDRYVRCARTKESNTCASFPWVAAMKGECSDTCTCNLP